MTNFSVSSAICRQSFREYGIYGIIPFIDSKLKTQAGGGNESRCAKAAGGKESPMSEKDTKPPLISILMRTHARGHLLRCALETVRAQTAKEGYEVVVVEDGTPTAQEVVQAFAPYFPVHYEATGTHVGRSAAGNRAARLAKGDYLCFFDDDDALLPHYVETWQALLREHPGQRLFFAASTELCGHYAADGVTWVTQSSREYSVQGATRVDVACNNIVPIQAVLFAKSLFEEYGGLDEQMEVFEDWDLWMRYASVQQPVACNAVTSEFKIPSDPAQAARRMQALERGREYCYKKAETYQLCTSMGAVARASRGIESEKQRHLREHAQEFRDAAYAVAGSASWRCTGPLRAFGRWLVRTGSLLSGAQVEVLEQDPARMRSVEEYAAFAQTARESFPWRLTAFLRREKK